MTTETQTIIDCGTDSEYSAKVEARYDSQMDMVRERFDIRRFGLISFEDYINWTLSNQIPLSEKK